MKRVNDIRRIFLDFFRSNDHIIKPSSSLVPHNDPSLMFTNSGMVQFKTVFTGDEVVNFSKAATSQKCVRAGGKHNDLDNAGYTARHHTFFEMLGNFSFGDYFKEQAIELAWNFLTKELSLPKEKLYVTIYHDDDVAFNLWKKISSLPESKIIPISTNDNFWSMGDTGPCGPCSEIFYDHGEHIFGGLPGTKGADGDRFIEIWNLVFMQFEQLADGSRISLPKLSIDTGMGLERISAVVQKLHDNYEIDLFNYLITSSQNISKTENRPELINSHKVIADHLRSSSFLLADGVMPSNEGRGYVLRRIMRRAMRHAHQFGMNEALLYQLVPSLVHEMGESYPELVRAQSLITTILKQEEEKFKITLSKGLKLLDAEIKVLHKGDKLNGEIAFKLYDTYGFPLDLTKDILRKKEISVDEDVFDLSMKKQKELAKSAWVGSGEKQVDDIWFDLYNSFGATEFLGYDLNNIDAKVIALIVNNKKVEQISEEGQEFSLLLNQTTFYAESGGQVGDIGIIKGDNLTIEITDTKKYLGHLYVHTAKLISGKIRLEDIVTISIDNEYRNKLRANHSATHLLHSAIRKIIGDHVTQKGSLVTAEKLRFDISHHNALSKDEINKIEILVNEAIRNNSKISTILMDTKQALDSQAIGLFGEKYADEVRVVSMGEDQYNKSFSKELCGGTHAKYTGDIGLFKIISEGSVAAGIRRIEAVTGENALLYIQDYENIIYQLSNTLAASNTEIISKIENSILERKKLMRELTDLKKKNILSDSAQEEKEVINGINFITKIVNDVSAKDLRNLADSINTDNTLLLLISIVDTKIFLVIKVDSKLTHKLNAIDIVKKSAEILGSSGGGGRPEFAQAGGSDIKKIGDVKEAIRQYISF